MKLDPNIFFDFSLRNLFMSEFFELCFCDGCDYEPKGDVCEKFGTKECPNKKYYEKIYIILNEANEKINEVLHEMET